MLALSHCYATSNRVQANFAMMFFTSVPSRWPSKYVGLDWTGLEWTGLELEWTQTPMALDPVLKMSSKNIIKLCSIVPSVGREEWNKIERETATDCNRLKLRQNPTDNSTEKDRQQHRRCLFFSHL